MPTPDITLLKRDFLKYCGRRKIKGRLLAVKLNLTLREWLALEHQQVRFHLNTMEVHELDTLICGVEKSIRKDWAMKGSDTKKWKKNRPAEQLKFKW